MAIGTIDIEPRFAELKLERLPSLASELVNANVDVIVALGGPAAVASQKATSTIPVIFSVVTDPVALKLVASILAAFPVERPVGQIFFSTARSPHLAA